MLLDSTIRRTAMSQDIVTVWIQALDASGPSI